MKHIISLSAAREQMPKQSQLRFRLRKYRLVYLLILPPVLAILVFCYLPMVGITMAFLNYRLGSGVLGMFTRPWIGLANFKSLLMSYYFTRVLFNTIWISLLKLIFVFPSPILLALLLNELRALRFKRVVQTVSYLPFFLSAVVVQGLVLAVFSPAYGLLNNLRQLFGAQAIHYLGDSSYFRGIIVGTDVWQQMGWGAIVYLAAITSIDPGLYEAAVIDGAGRLRQAWHITLASIIDIILMFFILRIGTILSAGFEMIFLLYSPVVYNVADIIDTYAYREGLLRSNFGYGTAIGLFKSAVGFLLIWVTNRAVRRLGGQGIW